LLAVADAFERQSDATPAGVIVDTLTGEYKVTDSITLTSRTRAEHSMLAYIGTLPNTTALQTANPDPTKWTFTASPQSRNQWVDILANQEEAAFKFDTGSVKHTAVVGLEVSNERIGIDDVAQRLAQLLALNSDKAVSVNPVWHRNISRHQHCRPINGVKLRDVFADQMQVCWPIALELRLIVHETDPGYVICQGINPDIDDLVLVVGNRKAGHLDGTRDPLLIDHRNGTESLAHHDL